MDLSDVDDEGSTHKQLAEALDEAFGCDGVYCTGEQWDLDEEGFEREDDVQFNDDEEVQSLIESESEALGSCLSSESDVDPSTTGGQR